MAVSRAALHEHKQRYGVMYLITGFGALLPVLTLGGLILNSFDNLATEPELLNAISTHNIGGMHPAAILAVGNVQEQLYSIQSFQIEERIEKQLKIICENSRLRDALEPTIKQLIRDYNTISPDRYIRPTCEQLGVIR